MNTEVEGLRDELAVDRTLLANERTFLAYVRTAIMLGVSGATVWKILGAEAGFLALGVFLLALSAAVALVGYARFHKMHRRILGRKDTHPTVGDGEEQK